MTLYLVRHGRAIAGTPDLDPGLDQLGQEQAAAAAKALAGRGAALLVVSPLRRTRETAEPIAAATGLEPEVRPEISEVFDPRMPMAERRSMIGPFMAGRWSEQPEHLRAWRAKVIEALLELDGRAAGLGGSAIAVSHYVAIGVAVGAAMDEDLVVPVPMANAAITTITVEDGRMRLVEACSTAHLGPEQITGMQTAMAGRG